MYTVTFYSYKGGVGRTLALVNTAYALATRKDSKKVVILDFDLEAPGVDMISPFQPKSFPKKGGIVEYVSGYFKKKDPDPQKLPSLGDYSYKVRGKNIRVIPAGKKDESYMEHLAGLSLDILYRFKKGYRFFENLKKRIEKDFSPDYLLIDSRTGLADISGITTRQMAQLVVLIFNLNLQNLEGIKGVYTSIVTTPKPQPAKTMLVASPVPEAFLQDKTVLRQRIKNASESMPDALNSDGIITVPYDVRLAFDDFVSVAEHHDSALSDAYGKIVDLIVRRNPKETEYLFEKAFYYQEENLVEEAEEEFENLVKRLPDNPDVYFHYGDFLGKNGKSEKAIKMLAKASELAERKNVKYLSTLGSMYRRCGMIDTALKEFKLAENVAPHNDSVLQNIANLYYKLEDHDNYLEYIKKRARIPGLQVSREDAPSEFERLYESLIKADLPYPEEFDRNKLWDYLKGFIFMNFREKISYIKSMLNNEMTYSQVLQNIDFFHKDEQRLYDTFGRDFEIIQEKVKYGDLEDINDTHQLEHFAKTEPENAAIFYFYLAIVLNEEKKYEKEIQAYENAIKASPNDLMLSSIYCNFSTALINTSYLQDSPAKEKILKEALDKARKAESIKGGAGIYNMACAYSLLGEKEKSISALKKAVKHDPAKKKLALEDKDFDRYKDDKDFLDIVS